MVAVAVVAAAGAEAVEIVAEAVVEVVAADAAIAGNQPKSQ